MSAVATAMLIVGCTAFAGSLVIAAVCAARGENWTAAKTLGNGVAILFAALLFWGLSLPADNGDSTDAGATQTATGDAARVTESAVELLPEEEGYLITFEMAASGAASAAEKVRGSITGRGDVGQRQDAALDSAADLAVARNDIDDPLRAPTWRFEESDRRLRGAIIHWKHAADLWSIRGRAQAALAQLRDGSREYRAALKALPDGVGERLGL